MFQKLFYLIGVYVWTNTEQSDSYIKIFTLVYTGMYASTLSCICSYEMYDQEDDSTGTLGMQINISKLKQYISYAYN